MERKTEIAWRAAATVYHVASIGVILIGVDWVIRRDFDEISMLGSSFLALVVLLLRPWEASTRRSGRVSGR